MERKTIIAGVVGIALLLAGSVAAAGFFGGFGSAADTSNAEDGPDDSRSAATPSSTPTAESANGTANAADATATQTATLTTPPTPSPTSAPTPTQTATPERTADEERTPILVRRFDEAEVERVLREKINDWREARDLQPFSAPDGSVSVELRKMAAGHSVGMADRGELVHEIDGNESVDRYEVHDLRRTCRFKKQGAQYIVTPERNRFEVLGHTYAGREYEGDDGTQFNENETQIAQVIFESWTENPVYSERLAYENANRIGIGIEISQTNEVYATGNVCGVGQSDS